MNNEQKEEWITHHVMPDGELFEMIYRPELNDTRLISFKDGVKTIWEKIEVDGRILAPYPPSSELIKKRVILFPSDIDDSSSEIDLIYSIQEFIHKYLDVTMLFEVIATYYVLLTYLYDKLPNILYLRFLGDFGSGKSRALKVVGNLCYRPMVATGSITTSVLFRIIDKFRGTLVLDEADFSNSDTYSEIIKILNSGYEAGKSALRSEGDGKKNWDVKAFEIYCPKVIATRFTYKDLALESRCLTEVMAKTRLREDIPLNLPDSFDEDALKIRNKLLAFRFKNFGRQISYSSEMDKDIEPRLRQITNVMMSVIKDEDARLMIKDFIVGYNKQLMNDRSLGFDGKIVQAIYNLKDLQLITVGMISEEYNRISEGEKMLTPGTIGKLLRSRLQINTEHGRDGRYISLESRGRLNILFTKFGLDVTVVADVTVPEGVLGSELLQQGQISI